MPRPGVAILVSGCDALERKKLELCRAKYPHAQLFFDYCPSPDVIVLQAGDFKDLQSLKDEYRLSTPSVIACGTVSAMPDALAAGCDDYICTPWEPVELFERAVRCRESCSVQVGSGRMFVCSSGQLLVCTEDSEYLSADHLTSRESRILRIMIRNRGTAIGRKPLSEMVGVEYSDGSRAIDMYISRLRKKVSDVLKKAGIPVRLNPIRTSSGQGWGIY